MAKKKRATGEGNIYQRPDGRWCARLSLGFDKDGNRQRKTVYGKTQAEVLAKLDQMKDQNRQSKKSLILKDSVGAYLQRWLDDDIAVSKAGKTHQEYELTVRLYIKDHIGHIKLTALDGEALVSWQASLKRAGKSANTRLRSIRVLRCALNKAVKLRLIPFNPVMALDKPKVTRKEVTALEYEQLAALFAECEGHRLGDMIVLSALTGLRKGELFALEWSAVNLREGVLVVRRTLQEIAGGLTVKEPKSAAGRRVINLDAFSVAALERRLKKANDEGFDPDSVTLVFPNERGTYMRSSNFDRRIWHPIRKAAELPESFVFHDLRHTHATQFLDSGGDMKILQKRLGHSTFETTANTYSHVLQNAQVEAVSKLEEKLRSKLVGVKAGRQVQE